MPPSTRRRAQRHLPPPPAEFSDSEDDLEQEDLPPEDQDDDDMGDDMAVMEGDEDLDDDALGKSYLVLLPELLFCVTLRDLHMPMHSIRKLSESAPHFGLSHLRPALTGGTNLSWLPHSTLYSLLYAGVPSSVSSVDPL